MPRLYPFASPCFVLCLLRVETEGLLDYQGRAGIISFVRWNLRPVIFGVEGRPKEPIRESCWAGYSWDILGPAVGMICLTPVLGCLEQELYARRLLCCLRQGMAGMSRDLGRDVPGFGLAHLGSQSQKDFMQENFGLILRSLIFSA